MLNMNALLNYENIKTALSQGVSKRLDKLHDAVKPWKCQLFLI